MTVLRPEPTSNRSAAFGTKGGKQTFAAGAKPRFNLRRSGPSTWRSCVRAVKADIESIFTGTTETTLRHCSRKAGIHSILQLATRGFVNVDSISIDGHCMNRTFEVGHSSIRLIYPLLSALETVRHPINGKSFLLLRATAPRTRPKIY
jgi:hypothetical protein